MARGGFDAAEGNFVAPTGTNSAVQQTNVQQQQSVDTKKRKSEVPIGRSVTCLKLEKNLEFLERLEARLAEEESEWYRRIRKYTHQLESEKLKASNFPARKIQIGNWEREATYDNNIVAKFYFAKKQLVWEVLEHEGGRKKKIDFSWSDISAIRATFVEGKASTLHIELENPPKFWLEEPPEPRKHVRWTAIPDFTNGEATECRRHTLTFAQGILEKHYEKLVHSSGALFVKNRGSFPMHNALSFTTDQVNESLKNQQDLRNQQYSSTTMCEGVIPTPQHVFIVPPLKQIPPEFPSESFSPSVGSARLHHSLMIGNMDLPSPDMHYAPMNEHAMPPESVSNFQPTSTSAELNAGMHVSFPRQSNRNLRGCCLTIENQRQEQPMRAYSTPAHNLYPRRVLVDPMMKFRASSIPSSSSLTDVTQGIQTPEGFYLNNGEEYNFGSTNSLVPAGIYNQNEVHGAPAGGDINIGNDGNVLENQKSLTNINHNDEMPENSFIFVNNESDILDMLDLSVDMQINQEPNTKPNLGESSGAGLSE